MSEEMIIGITFAISYGIVAALIDFICGFPIEKMRNIGKNYMEKMIKAKKYR